MYGRAWARVDGEVWERGYGKGRGGVEKGGI